MKSIGQRLQATGFWWCGALAFLVTLCSADPVQGGESVAQQIRQMTDARTRIAWSRQGASTKPGDSRPNYAIMVLDTNEGRERVLVPESYCRAPFITPTGKRVVIDDFETSDKKILSEKRCVYVVDWDGTDKRELCAAHYAVGVAEDPPGVEWAYYLDNQPGGKLWRVQIDDPKVQEVVWDKTPASHLWAFTRDGKTACAALPWPDVNIAHLPNGAYERVCGGGCLIGLAADGRHFLHCSNEGGDHTSIEVHPAPGQPGKVISIRDAPGVNGKSVMFPSWALYDVRFFVISGPQPGQNPHQPCRILFGQFNETFTGVAKWVVVSECPPEHNDCIASAWIQGVEVVVSPVAGLNVKLLGPFLKRLEKAAKLKPVLDELGKKAETTKNPDEAREAARIAAHIETWGKRQLKEAKELEQDSAKEAEAAYRNLAAKLDGVETGAAAQKRLQEADFQEGVRACPSFEKMQKAEKALVDVPGAERSATDIKFAAKNRQKLDEIRSAAASIQKQYPNAYLIPAVNELLEKLRLDPINKKAVAGGPWPADRTDLLFLWENRRKPGLAFDPAGKAYPTCNLTPRGLARFDHDEGLWLEDGAFLPLSVEKFLLVQKSSAFTLEAYLTPTQANCPVLAEIISFSSKADDANFVLGQLGDKLVMTLRTTQEAGVKPVALCALAANEPAHMVVTYAPGALTCYKNGMLATTINGIKGTLDNWTEQHLLFGGNWDGQRAWAGHLEGLALYTRTLIEPEAQQEYAAFQEKIKGRKPIPRLAVQAKLVAKSKTPTYEEVAPYTQALVFYEYEVEKVISGKCAAKTIRVAHHGMLDRKPLPIKSAEIGKSGTLILEPYDANPQLEMDYPSDNLTPAPDVPQFYDVGPLKK
jgi:hypothetical protein